MDNDNYNYLNKKIDEVGCLYKYDLLKDFLQNEYREYDYLYNFYTSCVNEIEKYKLSNCIYKLLWDWQNNNSDKVPDVMNSFNTYMNNMVKSIIDNKYYDNGSINVEFEKFKEILDAPKAQIGQKFILYLIRNHDIKKKMNENSKKIIKKMSKLSKWTNTIGNFVLLPNTKKEGNNENQRKNAIGKDRIDIYLYDLKNNFYKEDEFKKYINENYLWDYVDENYNIIPLFPNNGNAKIENKLPDDPRCYIIFVQNIISRIKRRGMFMEIMIRLRIESKKNFEDVNKIENLSSYSNVIETIKRLNISEELNFFIEQFQMGIV